MRTALPSVVCCASTTPARQPRSGSRWPPTLPEHDPRAVAEIVDAFHVASTTAVAVGELTEAVRLARLTDDPAHGHPFITAPRKVRAFALSGLFDEAVEAADVMWSGWRAAGCPPHAWMASGASTAALAHGLLGTGQDARLAGPRPGDRPRGRSGGRSVAGGGRCLRRRPPGPPQPRIRHASRPTVAKAVERAFAEFPEPWWVPYARAAGAELAVVAGFPDAEQYVERAVDRERLVGRRTAAGPGPPDPGPGRAHGGGGPVRADRGRVRARPYAQAAVRPLRPGCGGNNARRTYP